MIQKSQGYSTVLACCSNFIKKPTLDLEPVFVSRVRKVNFNEHPLWIQILRVKSFEDRYYLELKIEDCVLKK